MDEEFHRHEVVWTAERSRRFWDFISTSPAYEDLYFSRRVGDALLGFARAHGVPLGGRVLDFGCGPGYLLEKMAARGIAAEGVDFSRESVEKARQRLGAGAAGRVRLAEAIPTTLAAGSFDAVFLVETVEHLLDDDLEPTLAELRRLTRPGGDIVVTTPNDEELGRSMVMCPECGCVAHRMQHVRSWSAESLTAALARHGFERRVCRALPWMPRLATTRLVALAFRLAGRKMPDLVYIGRRSAG